MFEFHVTDLCPSHSKRTKQHSVRNARCTSCTRLLMRIPVFEETHAQLLERRASEPKPIEERGKGRRGARVPWAERRADCSILPAVYREMRAAASSASNAQRQRTASPNIRRDKIREISRRKNTLTRGWAHRRHVITSAA